MFDAAPATPAMQRARGAVEVAVALREGRSRLAHLFQQGSARALMPRVHGGAPEAVVINTAGGVTGGDRFRFAFAAEDGAALTVSTQAAERVYRASEGVAEIDTTLTLGAGAALDWLPQETILFDGCALRRSLRVEMAADARLTALESVVLGRAAMGETLTRALFSDQWRIRRDGKLVHAEALRLSGALASALTGPAALRGARAFATLIHAAPDACDRLEEARALLGYAAAPADAVTAAASARDGVLIVRFLGPDAAALRAALTAFLTAFRRAAPPRVWAL